MIPQSLLSIIIVNYNRKKLLGECLKSVDRFRTVPHEVIVVDNASLDGSQQYVREYFPHIKLICNQENCGFARGNNLGASFAKGDLLLLLNNDTKILTPFDLAIERFVRNERLGALGLSLRYGNGTRQASVGFFHSPMRLVLSWLGLPRSLPLHTVFRRQEYSKEFYSVPHEAVDWISGACLMIRTSLWKQLGGFDEDFFMYMEDVDLCHRVRKAGFLVGYIPDVEVVHYEGGEKAWIGELAIRRSVHSYMIYTRKFYGKSAVMGIRIGLPIVFLLRSAGHLLTSMLDIDRHGKAKATAFYNVALQVLRGRFQYD